MPICVPDSDLQYHLVCFDKKGVERETDGGMQSKILARALEAPDSNITDIFFVSHGWKGDVPAAIDQCNRWIGAMGHMDADRQAIRERDPNFAPLIVGVHWPSEPWGDEELPADTKSLLLGIAPETGLGDLVDLYAEAIASTPVARQALKTIIAAAAQDFGQAELDADVSAAYATLLREADLGEDDDLFDSEAEGTAWDPQEVFRRARASESGPGLLGGDSLADSFLSPLRQLSFWSMKKRARVVGETGLAHVIAALQSASLKPVRIHLIGHSFGCIVVSAAAMAAATTTGRPVSTLILIQGAMSLWSYSRAPKKDKPGYFSSIPQNGLVRGAIVTTLSEHDKAVGDLYPMASRLAKQYTLADLPLYGGVGTYGLCGLAVTGPDIEIKDGSATYGFVPGGIYNIDATRIIAEGGGFSGAHSDIAHPEVAHVAWEAIICSI